MSHLERYTGDDLEMIFDALKIAVPKGMLVGERRALLKGKFTAEHARIFESWGGFIVKDGDAKGPELEAALKQNGLPYSTGRVAEKMLRLAVNKIERSPFASMATLMESIPKPTAAKPVPTKPAPPQDKLCLFDHLCSLPKSDLKARAAALDLNVGGNISDLAERIFAFESVAFSQPNVANFYMDVYLNEALGGICSAYGLTKGGNMADRAERIASYAKHFRVDDVTPSSLNYASHKSLPVTSVVESELAIFDGDFELAQFDDDGGEGGAVRGGNEKAVGRLVGKRGLVYQELRFNQLFVKQRGRKFLLPMNAKWQRFESGSSKVPAQAQSQQFTAGKENVKAQHSAKARKVALVVGISKYRTCPLKNPVNDAKAVGAKLKSMDFAVKTLYDCAEAALSKEVRSFTDSLGKDVECGVFFFAGHGCEYNNQNFLMTTTECPDERDLPKKAVSAHEIQRDMEESGCVFPVLILDCCRVFEGMTRSTRAPPKGMAEMVPKGSYVALACAPNTCAEDGQGQNGTFTSALLKHIDTPGKDIDFILSDVRNEVESETNGRQRPWSNHQLKKRPACLLP